MDKNILPKTSSEKKLDYFSWTSLLLLWPQNSLDVDIRDLKII